MGSAAVFGFDFRAASGNCLLRSIGIGVVAKTMTYWSVYLEKVFLFRYYSVHMSFCAVRCIYVILADVVVLVKVSFELRIQGDKVGMPHDCLLAL